MFKPAILMLAAALASSSALAQPAARVDVQLANFKFVPKTIALRHGQPYVLRFANTAKGGHNFVAKGFFAAATIDPADRKRIKDGTVEVAGGQSVDIRLTAPAAGKYAAHCSHFMHSTFGMKGAIVVS